MNTQIKFKKDTQIQLAIEKQNKHGERKRMEEDGGLGRREEGGNVRDGQA